MTGIGKVFAFSELARADLVVDAVYSGSGTASIAGEPLHVLLGCGNLGGFRIVGGPRRPGGYRFAVLYTLQTDPDWPDAFVPETGSLVYYGDNKQAGSDLHATRPGGNELLRFVFERIHSRPPKRERVPPFFVFTRGTGGRDVVFRGLAAPGGAHIGPTEDLIALWRTKEGHRFQNYRATFTILDAPIVPRRWIERLLGQGSILEEAPTAWRLWVEKGIYCALIAPRSRRHRTEAEQLPATDQAKTALRTIWEHFARDPFAFEGFAARVWQMQAGAVSYEVTRRSVDGGRDAVGYLVLGPSSDVIRLDFALEAKCYEPGKKTVGVREVSRLISRLRPRQFGVLVTTSAMGRQAYQELREDGHPVVVISGGDLVKILSERGKSTSRELKEWLDNEFPVAQAQAADIKLTAETAR